MGVDAGGAMHGLVKELLARLEHLVLHGGAVVIDEDCLLAVLLDSCILHLAQ